MGFQNEFRGVLAFVAICGDPLFKFVQVVDILPVVRVREEDRKLRLAGLAVRGGGAAEELIDI